MERIKTLIIDDEALALEFLKGLIDWEEQGFQIIGTALSAEEGLLIFEENQADLVITDICMSDKSGLDLGRELKMIYPDVKLIILTAYKNFQYAQTAIEIGVIDYLVKHEITQESLRVKLNRVKEIFESNRKNKRLDEAEELKYLLQKIPRDEELQKQLCKDMNKEKKYFVIFVYFSNVVDEELSFPASFEMYSDDIQYIADFTMNEGIRVYLAGLSKSKYLLNPDCLRNKAEEILKDNKTMIENMTCVVNMSEHKIEELPNLYSMCLKYKEYMRLLGINESINVIGNDEISLLNREDRFSEYQEELFNIRESIRSRELYAAEKQLRRLYLEKLKKIGSIKDIHLCNQSIIHILKRTEESIKPGKHIDEEVYRHQLESCSTLEDICCFFISKLAELMITATSNRYNTCSEKIRMAVRFIHENYMVNLGINDIARSVGVSESYLVKNFKKEMGETILDYLTDVRINLAKELLLDADARIYEIAEKTGYSTSQYFSMVFLKKTGMTPKQYKNNCSVKM